MLRRTGFFHFDIADQSDPIRSLAQGLETAAKADDLNDCLIVVPEAFNIRNGYWSPDRVRDPKIAEALPGLANDFKVALVAGLVDEGNGGGPGYSTAYLIDRDCRVALTHKMQDDRSGNYKPCTENLGQTVFHRGICIAALLCMDAAEWSPANEQRKAVFAQTDALRLKHAAVPAVLSVPACMQTYGSREVAMDWPTYLTVVVANASRSQPSVIRLAGAGMDVEPICYKRDQNTLWIEPLLEGGKP